MACSYELTRQGCSSFSNYFLCSSFSSLFYRVFEALFMWKLKKKGKTDLTEKEGCCRNLIRHYYSPALLSLSFSLSCTHTHTQIFTVYYRSCRTISVGNTQKAHKDSGLAAIQLEVQPTLANKSIWKPRLRLCYRGISRLYQPSTPFYQSTWNGAWSFVIFDPLWRGIMF